MARQTTTSKQLVPRRSYNQYCAVVRALEVIGDRWTLLIVRDLMLGPKRYTDLLAGLPGLGTNLLADRLRELEDAGVVERRVLPPPAGSSVYQLTEVGEGLEPALHAIGRWGGQNFLGPPRRNEVLVPRPYFVAIRSSFRPEIAGDLRETYELRVGDQVFEVRVAGGRVTTREGAVRDPDVVFTMDVATLNALLLEGLTAQQALQRKRVRVDGDPDALARFASIFAIRPPAATPA